MPTSSKPSIRPAFHSRASGWLFCALMIGLFTFPFWVQRVFPNWRYPSSGVHTGPGTFSYIEKMVRPESGPIDILLIGDSFIRCGLDPNALEVALSKEYKHPIHVVTFGFQHRGEEIYFIALRALLQNKRPTMVVMDTTTGDRDEPHLLDYRYLHMDEGPDFYEGLTFRERFQLYIQNVLGVPTALLNELREPIVDHYDDNYRGNFSNERVVNGKPFVNLDLHPQPPFSADEMIYSEANREKWSFQDRPYKTFAKHYFDKVQHLLEEKHVPLVIIDMPLYKTLAYDRVTQRMFWPKVFRSPVWMVGIPNNQVFRGLDNSQIELLYVDEVHMNKNGARYFTEVVTPALSKLFGQALQVH